MLGRAARQYFTPEELLGTPRCVTAQVLRTPRCLAAQILQRHSVRAPAFFYAVPIEVFQLKVPKHEIGQSELFTPFKNMLLGHSKGIISSRSF